MKIGIYGNASLARVTGHGLVKHGHQVAFLTVGDKSAAKKLVAEGFKAETSAERKRLDTDITVFAVPDQTSDDEAGMDELTEALDDFSKLLKQHPDYHVVIIRTTLPPTTIDRKVIPQLEKSTGKKLGKDFGIVAQPDFSRRETAQSDFDRPWFILIGESDEKAGDTVEKLYESFNAPMRRCSLAEAEMQKYVHNAYNAVKIAFFNEIRRVCEKQNMDPDLVISAAVNSSEAIWNPLYGTRDLGSIAGSALETDIRNITQWARKNKSKLAILEAVIAEEGGGE